LDEVCDENTDVKQWASQIIENYKIRLAEKKKAEEQQQDFVIIQHNDWE
jgi:hypothetical protein